MNFASIKSVALVLTGVGIGMSLSNLPRAHAGDTSVAADMSKRQFYVFIDEIRQNFVFGDQFSGHYTKSLTLSDGSVRNIELTPMIHKGMQVVEFKDSGGRTYMGLNGSTTNGTLMVKLLDVDTTREEEKAQGWLPMPDSKPTPGSSSAP